jgi:4-hydroxybenzoate polyprenyltransferase
VQSAVPAFVGLLLVGNLFWVLAYDTEYAMVDRDDDLKIGMKTSAITFGRFDVAAVVVSYALFLVLWTVAGASRGLGFIFFVAMVLAAMQGVWHWRLIRTRTRDGCFKAFRLNHWLGFTVFAGVVAGYALR